MRRVAFLILFTLAGFSTFAQTYTFATYPFGDPDRIYRAFAPLVDGLGSAVGVPMRLVVTRDYHELSERIADGSVDFAWIGSANYVVTRRVVPDLRYLATYMERDASGTRVQPYYQSVILTLASSGIRDFDDLAGGRFGFTSPDSTSGYAYPRMILKNEGIEPAEYFRSVFFLGRHNDVIAALLAGSLDAGACSDGTYYNAVAEHGDLFRVLRWSEPIPLDAVVAAPHVGERLSLRVRDYLVSLGADDPGIRAIEEAVGWPAAGFSIRTGEFYDSVEDAMEYTAGQ